MDSMFLYFYGQYVSPFLWTVCFSIFMDSMFLHFYGQYVPSFSWTVCFSIFMDSMFHHFYGQYVSPKRHQLTSLHGVTTQNNNIVFLTMTAESRHVLCTNTIELFFVSPKNDPDINKGKGQSPSAYHTIGGRPVYVCQPGAHSQEIVPPFNNHFCAVYWPGDDADHCITFATLLGWDTVLPYWQYFHGLSTSDSSYCTGMACFTYRL
jgi:hypothetical protein